METNKTVSRLELSGNDFDDGAAIGIADMLDLNSTVKHLKVDHNDMINFGAERIKNIDVPSKKSAVEDTILQLQQFYRRWHCITKEF